MSQPIDRILRTGDDVAGGLIGSGNHDDRQAEFARRGDLGVGRIAAGVLGNDDVDPAVAQQRPLGIEVERSASLQNDEIGWQSGGVGSIDTARHIVVLRCGREKVQILAAETEEHTPWRRTEHPCGGVRVRHDLPAIAWLGLPGGAHDRHERNAEPHAGFDGIAGNLVGVGMRGIDHRIDALGLEPLRQTSHPAEAADARRDRLRTRVRGASGQRQDRLVPRIVRKQAGEGGCFGRAAENEQAHG